MPYFWILEISLPRRKRRYHSGMVKGLENLNPLPFSKRIKDTIHQVVIDGDAGNMIISAIDFYEDMGLHLSENYMQGRDNLEMFEDSHKMGDDEFAQHVIEEFDEVTPDTIRAYLISKMVPMLMDEAQFELEAPENLNPRKHELWDFITSLYEAARDAERTIQDGVLREETAMELDTVLYRIRTKLQSLKKSIN